MLEPISYIMFGIFFISLGSSIVLKIFTDNINRKYNNNDYLVGTVSFIMVVMLGIFLFIVGILTAIPFLPI